MEGGLAEVEPSVPESGATKKKKEKKSESRKKNWKAASSKVRIFRSGTKVQAASKEFPKTPGEDKDGAEEPRGSGCILPRCQRFNNVRCFMVFFCILLFSQGMVFGLIDMSVENFLKYYHLRTIESSALSLTYDISSCLVVVFISYYAERGNRPRWITVSSFFVGFGSLLFAFPYFSIGNYHLTRDMKDTCQATKVNYSTCRDGPSSFKTKYLSFFIIGQIIQGIAGIPLYILGVTFLDDSIAAYSIGVYLGLHESSTMLGYAFGYAVSAPLNASIVQIAEHSIKVRGNEMKWQWTWWMVFLLASLIAWSTLVPLSCFPQNLPGTTKIRAGKLKQSHWSENKYKNQEFGNNIKDLFATTSILMKNPVFMCLALSRATESLLIIGASEYLPVYMENQFLLTPQVATTLAGLVLIPGGALGHFLGGVIIYILEMSCKTIMKFLIISSVIANILLVFVIFIRCTSVQFAGITEDYEGTGQLGNLTAPCNSQCQCSTSFYSCICGRDGIEYFSACFAGCKSSKTSGNHKTYYNCSCITKGLTTSDNEGDFIDATSGKCEVKCHKLPLFISFIFSTIVFSCFSGIPGIMSILRVVSGRQRSVALGIAFVIMRIFGTIPGPILFKMSRENSCFFRDTESCQHIGSCSFYNKTKMVYQLVGLCFLCKSFTIFFTAIALHIYSPGHESTDMLPIPREEYKTKKKKKKEQTS